MTEKPMDWMQAFDELDQAYITRLRGRASYLKGTIVLQKMAAMLDDAEARLVALGADPPSAAMWQGRRATPFSTNV